MRNQNRYRYRRGYSKVESDKALICEIIILGAILVIGFLQWFFGGNDLVSDTYRTYKCDYKSTSIAQTRIETKLDDKDVVIIGAAAAKFWFTDPLTMYDKSDNVIAHAGDVYGFISQDDHGIYTDGEFDINMKGCVDLFGNTYELKDENGEIIATLKCDMFDSHGSVVCANGDVIATYSSAPWLNDYTVKICDNDVCGDESMLLVIASYISDVKYDS